MKKIYWTAFILLSATFIFLLPTLEMGCATSPPEEPEIQYGDSDSDSDSDDDSVPVPHGGCEDSNGGPAHPFGCHDQKYYKDVIFPDQSQSSRDQAVKNFYDDWKYTYLAHQCDPGQYYVSAKVQGSLTVSEAHGYGMLITAYMAGYDLDAKEIFDGMYNFFKAHPSKVSRRLMAWYQNSSCESDQGVDSATDGDLDIAYALLLADKQWGSGGDINYIKEAGDLINAIQKYDISKDDTFLLLGDWAYDSDWNNITRSSDFMPGHLNSFENVMQTGYWEKIINSNYNIYTSIQNNYSTSTGLLPDFVQDPISSPAPSTINFESHPGDYFYNACRTPWRIGIHYLLYGNTKSQSMVLKMNNWIKSKTGGNPAEIAVGYKLNGSGLPGSDNYESMAFIAPFGVAAMTDSNSQNWLNAIWSKVTSEEITDVYFEDTIKMLTLIIMSGNWWSPETASCP